MRYSFTIFASALLAVLFIGCSESESMYKIKNPASQEKLISELENRDIPVRVENNGEVWFPEKYSSTVRGIALKVMASSKPDRTTFTFSEPEYTDLFIEKLKEKNIPFGTEFRDGVKYVSLSQETKEQWSPIQDEIGNFLFEKKVQEIKKNE